MIMIRNKYTFAQELLRSYKLTPQQKERVLALIARERNEDIAQLEEKVASLEKNVSIVSTPIPAEEVKTEEIEEEGKTKDSLPNYINPFSGNGLTAFLLTYNQDPLLKYTCHTIGDGIVSCKEDGVEKEYNIVDYIKKVANIDTYTIREHQRILQERFNELCNEKKTDKKGKERNKYFFSKNIKNLILVYLTGKNYEGEKKGWSSDNIEINWANEELFAWSDTHPDCVPHPNGTLKNKQKVFFKLEKPFTSKLNGKRIRDFSDLVIHFKYLFHIRSDNSLKDLLEYRNKKWKAEIDFQFDEKFYENIELFTDVDKLLQIYDEILKNITDTIPKENEKYKLEEGEKHKIVLSFYEKEKIIYFEILHIHPRYPFYLKTSNNALERIGDFQTSLINKINGIANLYIEADFKEEGKSYQINLWEGKWDEEKRRHIREVVSKEEIEQVGGVKYKLRLK
jgi:hypothetical protein